MKKRAAHLCIFILILVLLTISCSKKSPKQIEAKDYCASYTTIIAKNSCYVTGALSAKNPA